MKSLSSRISFVVALSLAFATAESALPHPFYFRYGFAYIPLLIFAPLFSFKEWCLIVLFKILISAVFSLSLFSVGFFLTLFSSLSSGLVIYAFSRIKRNEKRLFSALGVSIVSSFTSVLVQFVLSYFLLFRKLSVFLLAPLLLTSLLSSIAVGLIALYFEKSLTDDFYARDALLEKEEASFSYRFRGKTLFMLLLSLIFIILLIFISSLISPEGEVLAKAGIFTIARASLMNAVYKSAVVIALFLLSFVVSFVCIKHGNFKNALVFKYYIYFLSHISFRRKEKGIDNN